jgi:hypothetical protein
MRFCDYLRVPYLLDARLVETSPGVWINRVSYPELGDCVAESPSLETALHELERRRLLAIIGLLDRGQVPPVPRPPLRSSDPLWIAEHSDMPADVLSRIRQDDTRAISPA